ncbi:hypothetical protein VST7929_02402 [Vibrio stylophorae]|uniref:MSHA biogenesis protein MshD n=1 Tax=Vibrio stylophorae TaxID=659351 RepID=A0ABM8ZVV4_9VIBR|nr:type II secretion system protein [Vibrio stylophorae]CAH0534469.1 hypothetical protein VST7929_02402 [Vibrio stylophorae]
MLAPKKQRGFTLIESIVAIVVLGFALMIMTGMLFPQWQQSAQPHYQARASALAETLLNEILARQYDQNSDPDGGIVRCDQSPSLEFPTPPTCSSTLGPDVGEARFALTDVDDYIGCWADSARECNGSPWRGRLSDILGESIADDYNQFVVDVSVIYDSNFDARADNPTIKANRLFKRVELEVKTQHWGEYQYAAYKGNY